MKVNPDFMEATDTGWASKSSNLPTGMMTQRPSLNLISAFSRRYLFSSGGNQYRRVWYLLRTKPSASTVALVLGTERSPLGCETQSPPVTLNRQMALRSRVLWSPWSWHERTLP